MTKNNNIIFIKKTKDIHGDKYNYSKIKYINAKTKICIICPKHGEFWQTPSNHLSGKGCPICGKEKTVKTKRKSVLDFVEKAKKIHNNKYYYSKVEYKNNKTKVCIICPQHGEFWQIPSSHLQGSGCPKCSIIKNSNSKRNNLSKFIYKAQKIHNGKYDYSKSVYTTYHSDLCIICPKHSEFWQSPATHLRGCGCPQCGIDNIIEARKYTTKSFIEKAQKIHHNQYDYSKVKYIDCQTKICIVCSEHGEFYQLPSQHLQGCGCPKCGYNKSSDSHRKTTQKFIEESLVIQRDKYDYSKSIYKNANSKICIICPKHGEFWQTPYKHLQGQGCPICKSSRIETEIRNLLLDNNIQFEEQKKFPWLGLQSLDFYLPNYCIAIECQGLQHFEPLNFFGGEKELERLIQLDKRKLDLCKINNITILYYANYHYDFPYEVITNKTKLINNIKT